MFRVRTRGHVCGREAPEMLADGGETADRDGNKLTTEASCDRRVSTFRRTSVSPNRVWKWSLASVSGLRRAREPWTPSVQEGDGRRKPLVRLLGKRPVSSNFIPPSFTLMPRSFQSLQRVRSAVYPQKKKSQPSPHGAPPAWAADALNRAQRLPLVRRQLRVPHVHDEDEAVGVGVLPHLVLEGVVEDQDFPLLPLPDAHRRTQLAPPPQCMLGEILENLGVRGRKKTTGEEEEEGMKSGDV